MKIRTIKGIGNIQAEFKGFTIYGTVKLGYNELGC